jgi:CDP-glucose 4,6-dehydratase
MKEYSSFFFDKKILVTGHTGFIGSWLTKWLALFNGNVCGYSLDPPYKPNMYEILNLHSVIKDVRCDIRNTDCLRRTLEEFQPEIVFHLAAQPIVLEAYENPIRTFDVNVTGTVNLLNELRKIKSLKTIIVMTSDKSYHNNEWVYPYRENDALGGRDPYSASKSCQDVVVNSFRESYFSDIGIGISSVRAGNVIGGGDWGKYRIIPDIVKAINSNDTVKLRNPNSIRPWQFVLEPISGMLLLAKNMYENIKFSGAWNFGPESWPVKTVMELAEKFMEYFSKGKYQTQENSNSKESRYLQLDISKAKKELGWLPRYDFEKSVKKTAEWYKFYYASQEMAKYTENQIYEYLTAERY